MSLLKFTKKEITDVLSSIVDDKTLIVVDSFSEKFSIKHHKIGSILEDNFDKVIAIGGCTCLDKGKEIASGRDVIVIPTILSTSCISVNRSVCDGVAKKTTAPIETIICVPEITRSPSKWFQSGFADVFSNISASIDIQSKTSNFDYKSIRDNIPFCFDLLSWVEKKFNGFDEACVRKLSRAIHESSLMVIKNDDVKLSSAGEHRMYHNMMRDIPTYTKCLPTHGQLVSIGTLMSAKLFSDDTGDNRIYDKLRSVYSILGLPTTSKQLVEVGVELNHIKESMKAIEQFYLNEFSLNHSFDLKIRQIYP
jgi:glycerol dehydrogenase-like iron-containing ADH family enzyme